MQSNNPAISQPIQPAGFSNTGQGWKGSGAGYGGCFVKEPKTVWQRYSKRTGKYEHNHTELGHAKGIFPRAKKPEFTEQAKNWANADGWRKIHVYSDGSTCAFDSNSTDGGVISGSA